MDKHQYAIAESDQEEDMNEKPSEPGDESGDMDLSELRDRGGAAYRRQAAFVPVLKILAGLSGEIEADRFGNEATLLHRDRSYAGKRLSSLVLEGGEITDHKNLGMTWDAEIGQYLNAARAVTGSSELLTQ